MPPHKQPKKEPVVMRFTRWMGSPASLAVHTLLFAGGFAFVLFDVPIERVLLALTTAVSLEAIYLSLFIQMTVNRQSESIEDVAADIDEIQEDVDEIQEDVDEIQGDVDEIQEDIDEIQEDVDEIQEDVVGISADIDEISEEEAEQPITPHISLDTIYADLKRLIDDVEKFKEQHPKS